MFALWNQFRQAILFLHVKEKSVHPRHQEIAKQTIEENTCIIQLWQQLRFPQASLLSCSMSGVYCVHPGHLSQVRAPAAAGSDTWKNCLVVGGRSCLSKGDTCHRRVTETWENKGQEFWAELPQFPLLFWGRTYLKEKPGWWALSYRDNIPWKWSKAGRSQRCWHGAIAREQQH